MEATFYSQIANERMTSKVKLLTEKIKSKFDFDEFNVWSHQDCDTKNLYQKMDSCYINSNSGISNKNESLESLQHKIGNVRIDIASIMSYKGLSEEERKRLDLQEILSNTQSTEVKGS